MKDWARALALVALGAFVGGYRWFGREAKEVTLVVGFGFLFAGLLRVDATIALVIVGGLLVRLAWPTPPPPAPVCAALGSPQKQPTGSR